MSRVPPEVRNFTRRLAADLVRTTSDSVVGVYLHGSAVLGDWTAGVSDVDVLVVVRDQPASTTLEHVANLLVGDTDLVLHYAVTRQSGWTAFGPNPATIIGPLPHAVVTAQLAAELRWALEHASESYAVLNACRALRFAEDGRLVSKTDGGRWAIAHRGEPDLVLRALEARQTGASSHPTPIAVEWVSRVAEDLLT